MLGNLGQRLRSFDDQYAHRVREAVIPSNPDGSMMSVGRGMAGGIIGTPLTYGLPEIDRPGGPRMIDRAAQLGMPAASATVRYVIPAAGLTAAGMQLAELTGGLYDYASEKPVLGQL
jgi:hypothetical protein